MEIKRSDTKNITCKQLVQILRSKEVREVMMYNQTLDNMFQISKKSILSTLTLEENLSGMLPAFSVELNLGCLYIY